MAGQYGTENDMLNLQHGPKVINLNTYIQLAGFMIMILGGAAVGGVLFSEIRTGLSAHAGRLDSLDKRVSTLETAARMLDNHELRLANVENRAAGSDAALRTLEGTLNNLGSDVRVVKEILIRIEGSGNGAMR